MTVVDAIVQALGREFGDACGIYTEKPAQELAGPYFLVETVETAGGQYLGNRYFRETSFCIRYFPSALEPMGECNAAAERLFWLMECLPFGDGAVRGTKMRGEMENGTLKFFVSYKRFLLSSPEADQMEQVKVGIDMKGEIRC